MNRGTAIAAAGLVACALVGTPCAVNGQELEIGIIDLYGLNRVPAQQVREALTFAEGDLIAFGNGERPAFLAESEQRLTRLPDIVRARIRPVCCDGDRAIVYIGIEERGAATMRFHAEPQGGARLATDIVRAGEEGANALRLAVLRGDTGEDLSRGHSLANDPATRAVQERFMLYAARDLPELRWVLRSSSDTAHRALAAQVLGYAADKPAVVDDLVYGMNDPSDEVRNNAMRTLMAFRRDAAWYGLRGPARLRATVHRPAGLAGVVRPKQGFPGADGAVSGARSRASRAAAGTGARAARRDGAVEE